jgi:hypothetical protein
MLGDKIPVVSKAMLVVLVLSSVITATRVAAQQGKAIDRVTVGGTDGSSSQSGLSFIFGAVGNREPTTLAGGANGDVTVRPDSLTFPDQLVGTKSGGKTVTFFNGGSVDIYFTSIEMVGVNADQFSFTTTCPVNGSALAPGSSCTSTVYYIPSFPGFDLVYQLYNGNFTELEVSIGGTGTAVVVQPKELTFPKTMVGDTSPSKTVTFKNVGSTALPITSVSWSGTEHYFSETNTCGTSVPANSSCVFSIRFSPLTSGTSAATLWIGDPDPSGPQRITVMGTGVTGADGPN